MRQLIVFLGISVWIAPSQARGSFLAVNGLSHTDLTKHKVSVALVRVLEISVQWRNAHARSGHLRLALEDRVHGPPPSAASLRQVPYTAGTGYSSAWPNLGEKPTGSYLVMAWRGGKPCGEGAAVNLGDRFSLPLIVSGPGDPRVAAVKKILSIVSGAEEESRLVALVAAFDGAPTDGNPYLSLFADAALCDAEPKHRTSAARYARLLALLSGAPGADEELGWPLIQELTRFPPILDATAYASWHGGSRGPGKQGRWPAFAGFRRLLQDRYRRFAAGARMNLRRWALTALASSPSFLGKRKDGLDARAVSSVADRLRDATLEVRREAIKALLAMAATVRESDRPLARLLVGKVRAAQRREKDPEERQHIQTWIDELSPD
jgi:uncharacterized membrane protein